MENLNTRVIKEPRGFIRIVQFVFAILAFSTVVGFETLTTLKVTCPDEKIKEGIGYKINYEIDYPFKFEEKAIISKMNCSNTTINKQTFPMDFSSSAQFFVTVGVLSLLYSVGSILFYVFMTKNYETNPLLPMIDLIVTAILSVFWIAGAFAWVFGVSDVKHYTNPEVFKENIPDCNPNNNNDCSTEYGGDWASLNVSMIMGFGNAFIWCASIWFIFKETSLHRKQPMEMGEGTQAYDNYAPPNQQMPQPNPFQPPQQQQQFSAY